MTANQPRSLPPNSLVRYGCYVGLAIAAALFGTGVYLLLGSAGDEQSPPFIVALLVTGLIELICCVTALRGHVAGWAFATALNGTLGVAFFFGAPVVRDGLGSGIALGLLPCVALFTATVLLVVGRGDFD
ncbi:MAG: hypothetical protein AAGC55_03280 [Myxococcota bacterium]